MPWIKRHAPIGGAVVVSVLGLLVVLLVAFVVMPSRSAPGPSGARIDRSADARARLPVLRPDVVRVRQGDVARFRVRLSRADTLHVRGLGVRRDVRPGRVAKIAFRARRAGTYAVELHRTGAKLAIVRVTRR